MNIPLRPQKCQSVGGAWSPVVICLALGLFLTAVGCSATDGSVRDDTSSRSLLTARSQHTRAALDTAAIAFGDSVSLYVWGFPEFTVRTIVKSNGTVTLPLLGEKTVAGLRKSEFEDLIRRDLVELVKGNPKIIIEILNPSPMITVLGAVAQPGSFVAVTDMTLLQVLARVGGWTERAELRFIRINRPHGAGMEATSFELDLELLISRGNMQAIPVILPGDVVIVPPKENFVRDVSEFMRDAILVLGLFRIAN